MATLVDWLLLVTTLRKQLLYVVVSSNSIMIISILCTICVLSSAPLSIFLIDHAWTYQLEFARQQLLQIPGLASRMARLMGLVDGEGEVEEDVELEETEEKEEENGKLSEEEAQDKLEPVSAGSAQQQDEEVACHAAVENTETVEVEDILTELWR